MTFAFGFVVLKLAFKVAAIRVGPSALAESVFNPFSDIFHAGCIEDVGALAVLFATEPVAAIDILVWVNEHPFPLFFAIAPLPIILALVSID